ncbi:hypothetical protein K7432_011337 [Basidiobolus ranarum]|uniref:Hikeshi-like domain-containing protein n=1 Tax=Basidiobolus ranarum TaxID=34480 RepID=A0ABR2VUU9_9FUNG
MFGCIVAGRLVQTNLQQVDVNKYVFELVDAHNINHIIVFLLGTIPFEPGFAATVHFLWPNKNWQMLGVLSNDKPSAVFRLQPGTENSTTPGVTATLGISIEPINLVEQQYQAHLQSTSNNKPAASPIVIAERILNQVYNFVTSYVSGGSNDMIPLKAFENWYQTTQRKVKADPSFLLKNSE